MADLTDVENYLVNAVSMAVYPNGTSNPSVAGINAMVYAGYPTPPQLDADFSPTNPSPRAHININFLMDKDSSNILNGWQTTNINAPTLTLTVNLQLGTITVGGIVSVPENCAITVNTKIYTYSVQSFDTLFSIAYNIAALIPNATVLDNVVTVPNAYLLLARIGSTGTAINAVGQQQAVFKITVLAPSNAYRTAFSAAIQGYLDANYRFTLPDTTGANLVYKTSKKFDEYQKTIIYRRDLMYQVTYYTTIQNTFYTIVDPVVNISDAKSIT